MQLDMRFLEQMSFNPHPSRRTGATVAYRYLCAEPGVSILTRPEGRVQLTRDCGWGVRWYGFNPHPSRRTGATKANVLNALPL